MPKSLISNPIDIIRKRIFEECCKLEVNDTYITESPLEEKDRIWLLTKLPRKFGENRKFISRFNDNNTLTIQRIN